MRSSRQNLSTLLFEWPMKQAPRLALPFFILLAALFHLSTIYLFNIVYQPSHVSKPVPAQVLFLSPNAPSSQQISSWLKSNDPSIFSPLKTVQQTRTPLSSSIYEPGPASLPVRPLPALEKKDPTDLLPPPNEITLPPSLRIDNTSSASIVTPFIQQATTIQLLDALSTRSAGKLGTPSLPPEVNLPLPPTTLTLNIDAEGIPRHVIVSQSCGNTAADETASSWAISAHFAPADHETWGSLLVIWGNK
ncbi:MAG: hypothetical protein K2W97_06845 [Chthoniobacterales bacterium]|nr:hypothetical protein [Chthoniobacterales bacterium]